ncbi:uncharacterized protein LOC131936018 [Physella acuta]|uniref:uncharacterized protein LOC131936018 n=1 Tax=Physella acuta TaxID=109671 RepID=UPI0027DC0E09|nr:uncharacterized protein LOC131936018 [Physella acuta]
MAMHAGSFCSSYLDLHPSTNEWPALGYTSTIITSDSAICVNQSADSQYFNTEQLFIKANAYTLAEAAELVSFLENDMHTNGGNTRSDYLHQQHPLQLSRGFESPVDEASTYSNMMTKPADVEAKDCDVVGLGASVMADDQTDSTVQRRRKKKHKVRRKSFKKWKQVDSSELGFYVSCSVEIQICEEETDNEITKTEDWSSEKNNSPLNVLFTAGNSASDEVSSEHTANNMTTQSQIDDATFFASLGIDINDNSDDVTADEMDINDWDYIVLERKVPVHCFRHLDLPTKVTNDTKTKSSSVQNKSAKCLPSTRLPYSNDFLPIKRCDVFKLHNLECASSARVYIRADRDRRVEKAHKAVKSKNCNSIFNNKGHKLLYMHHRLVKMHNLCLDFRQAVKPRSMPMTTIFVDLKAAKEICKANKNMLQPLRPPPAQNLKHALHETNAPRHLETELASFLISLQHRELTPEDYDMLLRLDDSVKPKTVAKSVINTLKTEKIELSILDSDEILFCTICMEPYIAGQERKFLPCEHNFHSNCIDKWLANSSMNCPLDGLPIGC